MTAQRVDPNGYPPRGMDRESAARWIGVGTTKFDEMVADKRMPQPKVVDGRILWDRFALDLAFSELPDRGGNVVDTLLSRRRQAG